MKQPEILDFFTKLTMRVRSASALFCAPKLLTARILSPSSLHSPKSYAQAENENKVVYQFLDNFSGDNVRRGLGRPVLRLCGC